MQFTEKQRKWLAWTAALLILALVSFSCLFIASHTDHDCAGEDCAVCAELKACDTIVRGLGRALKISAASVILWKLAESLCSFYRIGSFSDPVSLVSLKIRLDN